MDIIRKTYEAVIDSDSLTDASPEKPFGGFKAVASDESRDRDQENLYQDEWITPLPDHITIDTDHGMSVATTVGSARPYFEGNEMWIDASFSSIERAQETRALILEGHIKTVSVAALVDRSQKSGTPRRELLNVGIVAIPSNRNAIIFDAKSFTKQTVDEAAINFLLAVKAGTAAGNSDSAMVQAIHDAAGHLGAACIVVEVPVEAGPEDPSGAEDGANKGLSPRGVETKEGDPRKLVAAIDAILDEAISLTKDIDRSSLPEPVGQALDLIIGAGVSVGKLMKALSIFDPDAKSVSTIEAEEVEEDDSQLPSGDEPPEVDASTEKFTTRQILDAILGASKSIEVDGLAVTADQFKDVLQAIITNASTPGEQTDSPADSPVEKSAAATDEVPAPDDETADDAADDVAVEKRARQMRMALQATSFSLV